MAAETICFVRTSDPVKQLVQRSVVGALPTSK